MTRDRSVDERIGAWLHDEAPVQLPDRVLRATFERTEAIRQRRTLLGWRVPAMRRLSLAIAAGATVIALLVVAVNLLRPPNPSVGTAPTSTPTAAPFATASPQASPAPSATLVPVSLTGQIAFERRVDGNTDLYLMNADRTGLLRLTSHPASETNAGWSPDGAQLVFNRQDGDTSDLYVIDADGGNERRLTSTPGGEDDARFSPDGQTIAFWGGPESGTASELFLIDRDGTDLRSVVRFEDTFAAGVAWSRDGLAIYFNRDLSEGGQIDILRIDVASGEVVPVTESPGDDSSFAISPDGLTIAFQSDRSPGGIFLMDIDGGNVRHLTGDWRKGFPSSWSPDGQHLAFATEDGWLNLVSVAGLDEPIKWTEGGPGVAWRPTP